MVIVPVCHLLWFSFYLPTSRSHVNVKWISLKGKVGSAYAIYAYDAECAECETCHVNYGRLSLFLHMHNR